nr:tetratricopeptide repeat protein [Dactylosporangium thailandense]
MIAAALERVRDTDPADQEAVIDVCVEVVGLAGTLPPDEARPLLIALAGLALRSFLELGDEPLVAGLARNLWRLGATDLSVLLLERAEAIAADVGEPLPTILVNLRGDRLWQLGDLDGAEVCFQRVLAVLEHDSARRAAVLSNLGNVYQDKGDPARAKSLFAESLRLGDPSGRAITLDNLALAELSLADRAGPLWTGPDAAYVNVETAEHLDEAAGHFRQARELFEAGLPDSADDLVLCLHNSARVAQQWRDLDGLDELSATAAALVERHQVTAESVWLAAGLRGGYLLDAGRPGEAVEAMLVFGELWARGVHHASKADNLMTLLRAAAMSGHDDVAQWAARATAATDDRLVEALLGAASDAEARHRFRGIARRTEQLLGACAPGDWPAELVVNRKGVLAERQGAAWLRAFDAPGLVDDVRRLRARAAALDLDGTGSDAIRAARQRHDEAMRALGDAQARLHRAVGEDWPPFERLTLDDVRAVLDASTLLLEFAVAERPDGTRHHLALFIRAEGPVEHRDLGPVGAGERPPLFTADDRLPARIVIAPTGTWGVVPFASLPGPGGRPLIDDHVVQVVPSARWLVLAGRRPPPAPASPPLVLGDADFDLDFDTEFFLTRSFERLVHTAAEASDSAARLGVEPVLGRDVTRQRLLDAHGPRVLHIASHGTFVDAIGHASERMEPRAYNITNVGGTAVSGSSDWSIASRPPPGDARERHVQRVKWLDEIGPADPLSRSVLVLAGVNAWLAGVVTPDAVGTGLLTAGEFALLDLAGTELVVLSACESGAGAVDYADGSLMGLRTAALLAGARCCVSSLWTVRDDVAAALVAAFYRHLIGTGPLGGSVGEALRAAQLEIRAVHADPRHWAGWVVEGLA